MLRVLVTGDRYWDDPIPIWIVLGQLYNFAKKTNRKMMLIEGGASGADTCAAQWAAGYKHDKKFRHVQMLADWDNKGRAAGPIRNQEMLKKLLKGPADAERYVFGFHSHINKSKGTKHMLKIARKQIPNTYLISHGDCLDL